MKGVRVFDAGSEVNDRYTAVYTKAADGGYYYLGMNSEPFHPQGFGQHGHFKTHEAGDFSHLGTEIKFKTLPVDCQKAIRQDMVTN